MITKQEKNILEEMKIIYTWSDNTFKLYETVLKNYLEFNNAPLNELIQEAESEEETIRKISRRTITTRLKNYRLHLQQNKTPNTVKSYTQNIIKIYKYLDIETPHQPPIKNNIIETFEDIPTKEEIQKAIFSSRTKLKALISFIASSGLRRSDVANLTIQDFINATREYHQSSDLLEVIQKLEHTSLIIPTWNIKSVKTNINHIAYSSHESSLYIIQMLRERILKKEVNIEDSLFEMQPATITKNFRTINEKLGYGRKTTRRYFHPHALRKFFATTLTSNDISYLDTQFLLGHSLSSVDSSYYFCNEEKLKNKYIGILDSVTFTMSCEVCVESDELEELKRFKLESNRKIRQLEEMIFMLSKD